VVGIYGAKSRLLRVPNDWTALVGGWRPTKDAIAITACSEVVHLTRTRNPYKQPFPFMNRGVVRPDLMPTDTAAILKHATPPKVTHSVGGDDQWHVDAWIIDPTVERIATHYICDLRMTEREGRSTIDVAAVDSLMRLRTR
jgi:hypothetical protein